MHLQTTYRNITERKITNTTKIRQFVLSSCFWQKLLIKQYTSSRYDITYTSKCTTLWIPKHKHVNQLQIIHSNQTMWYTRNI